MSKSAAQAVTEGGGGEKESVSLASTIFARLHPVAYLSRFLSSSIRPDGRSFDGFRPVTVGVSTVDSADGSCIVRLGNTIVIAGVKAELLDTSDEQFEDDLAIEQARQEREQDGGRASATDELRQAGLRGLGPIDRRRVVVGVDLTPMSSARFRPGPPGEEAQVLASRVMRTLDACAPLSASSLVIQRGRLSWCLYVDVVCIAYDGNPFDAVILAVAGALQDVRLPVDIEQGDEMAPLQLHALPLAFSFAIVDDKHLLSDANAFEASMTTGTVTVVLDASLLAASSKQDAALVEIHCSGPITALLTAEEVRRHGLTGTDELGETDGLLRVQDDQLVKLCIARATQQCTVLLEALRQARQPSLS